MDLIGIRGKKHIDLDAFEKLCNMQSTMAELEGFFGVDESTVRLRVEEHYGEPFPVIFERFKQGGKASLRRKAFQRAEKSDKIFILLMKNYLGIVDKQEIKQEIDQKVQTIEQFIRTGKEENGRDDING